MRKQPSIPSKKFWEDDKWAHENYVKLAEKYPSQWIAVLNKKVVANNEDLGAVTKRAGKMAGSREFPLLFMEGKSNVY